MTKKEQITFVKNFCNAVRDHLVGKMKKGNVPENWMGHELREFVCAEFDHERDPLIGSNHMETKKLNAKMRRRVLSEGYSAGL